MENFDLKAYLRNNQLLTEAKEDEKEEVKEGYGKMKKSELKEKIREEILEAMKAENDDPTVGDEEEAHSGVAEAEEDEEAAPEADIDVDADIDIEEPVDDIQDEPVASDPSGAEYKSAEQMFQDIVDIGMKLGDESLVKMGRDGARYSDKESYKQTAG